MKLGVPHHRPPGRRASLSVSLLALALALAPAAAAMAAIGLVGACLPLSGGPDVAPVAGGKLPSPPFADLYDTPARDELPGQLVIYFLDTGQSDAAYVRAPDGKVMVIDTGDADDPGTVLGFLTGKRVSRVDALVLTHPHADHIGDALAILQRLEVGTLWHSGFAHATPTYEAILTEAVALQQAGRITTEAGRAGLSFDLGSDVTVTVFHPTDPLADEANEASVVIKVTYADFSALFTGDIGTDSEAALLARGADIRATVLKVAHHGSAGSSGEAFLAAVDPEVAVIDVGAGNSYGHPSPAVLDRLEALGVAVFRTDRDGTIIVHSDGHDWGLVAGD